MWLFRAALIAGFCGGLTSACATAQPADSSPPVRAEQLPFPGETSLVLIEQSGPDQAVAIVESCAPFPEGCAKPQLKARSVQTQSPSDFIWEFADLRNCPGAQTLVTALLTIAEETPLSIRYAAGPHLVKSAREHAAEDLVSALSACLSRSYMTPPWER